jgi:hypothetical protein
MLSGAGCIKIIKDIESSNFKKKSLIEIKGEKEVQKKNA